MSEDLTKYFGAVSSFLTKGERTASGETDDKTPAETSQTKGLDMLSTDSRKLANKIFTPARAKIPAELLGLADTYDTAQACTRVNKVYRMDRKEFYKQATVSGATREARLARKQQLAAWWIKTAEEARKSQET